MIGHWGLDPNSDAEPVAWANVHECTLSIGSGSTEAAEVEADQAVPVLTDDLDYWDVRLRMAMW